MDFRILGPLEVVADDRPLDLGGQKQRVLLAVLLLDANRPVSRQRLIDALWEDDPPDTAQKTLHVHVSGLRKTLGRERIVTKAPGYLVRVDLDELDLDRFRRLREEGKLDEALSLWRGPALAEFSQHRFATTEAGRLEELRLACLEERIGRDLDQGRHVELVAELEPLVREHPLREGLRAQLMLALYRSGRQAEALDVYQDARRTLVEELGLEPGRALRDLHQAILNQDPALEVATEHPGTPPATTRPTGTVTLLFADIEGSTRLLQDLGGEYGALRARIRALVRAIAARYRGHEVDWAGDGVFLAFERAREAVGAAIEIQRRLAAERWPEDTSVRMRIGVHTGEPDAVAEGYIGLDVHVAARICAASHGGQIVVSRATRDFVSGEPATEVTFRPLGTHRLRDVTPAQPLFQVVAPGIEDEFPPLQTFAGATLPALHHRLVGRSAPLEQIQVLIARPEVRLVTITGPGGAGKSRLALEVAGAVAVERPVHLVGLAPISDPELVPAAIARAIGVRESPGHTLVEALADALGGTRALLFLDNLEHLAPAARHVADLLHRTPGVDVLTTSRAPLRLSGEHIVPLGPLELEDAATFFFELAAARGVVLREDARPSVYEICRRLDGLPLAIELVAARLAVLPPARILEALDEGLALEMEGPVDLPERQRTLRATIDWSYGLLDEPQRDLLGALAAFAGGCSLDDAKELAGAGPTFLADLEALVGWSLVRSDVSDGDVRLSMLETVREDAVARLAESGQLEELRRRHAERFLGLAATAEEKLRGPDQTEWLERLERELDNIRAALDWCFTAGCVEDALRAVSGLNRFWRAHGHAGEARRWLSLGLELAADVAREVRADALWTAARQAAAQSDWDAAVPLLEQALALFREQGREQNVVFALSELGFVALRRNDHARAAELCEEALAVARELGDARATSAVLSILAEVSRIEGNYQRAVAVSEEAVALRRSLGDLTLIADSTYHLGVAAFGGGDLDRAEDAFEEVLSLARDLSDALYTAAALCMLGTIALLRDDAPHASDRLRESLDIYAELGDRRSMAECLTGLGGCAATSGEPEDAVRLWGAADALREDKPLEYAEPVIESRFGPQLIEKLGSERYALLRAEGRRLGHEQALARSGVVVAAPGAE